VRLPSLRVRKDLLSVVGRREIVLKTRITGLLGIRYPILQGAMAWITGPEMVTAVCEAGGLGSLAT
jgi:IMP dehydrogenase/GMP reductase